MRQLAEDDKDGVMATKVLEVLWNLAHSPDLPIETVESALRAHVKVLESSCSGKRDELKVFYIEKSIAELADLDWVVPALKQIDAILHTYHEATAVRPAHQSQANIFAVRPPFFTNRQEVINHYHVRVFFFN